MPRHHATLPNHPPTHSREGRDLEHRQEGIVVFSEVVADDEPQSDRIPKPDSIELSFVVLGGAGVVLRGCLCGWTTSLPCAY